MQIHLIYILNDDCYKLYGYSLDYKLGDRFIKERKKGKFKIKEKYISERDYVRFTHKYSHMELKLIKEKTKFTNSCEFEFVLTDQELTKVFDTCEFYTHQKIWQYINTTPNIFNWEYFKVLDDLMYNGFYIYQEAECRIQMKILKLIIWEL